MTNGIPALAARACATGSTTPCCSQINCGLSGIASSTTAPACSLRRNTSTTAMESWLALVDVRPAANRAPAEHHARPFGDGDGERGGDARRRDPVEARPHRLERQFG